MALGYLEWRRGRTDVARASFSKAYELGARTPRFLWDFGRMAAGSDAGRATAAMSALLELEPGRTDVRVELAGLQLSSGRNVEARDTLRVVRKVTPELAPRFFQVLAYVEQANGSSAEATKAARRWQETASAPSEKEAAGRFAESVARSVPGAITGARAEQAERPTLRRADVAAPPLQEAGPATPKFDGKAEGQFVELQCNGSQALFVIEVEGRRQPYLIDDPLKIVIAGADGGSQGLTCGKQRPRPVKLEFDRPGAGQTAALGLLRLVDFNP